MNRSFLFIIFLFISICIKGESILTVSKESVCVNEAFYLMASPGADTYELVIMESGKETETPQTLSSSKNIFTHSFPTSGKYKLIVRFKRGEEVSQSDTIIVTSVGFPNPLVPVESIPNTDFSTDDPVIDLKVYYKTLPGNMSIEISGEGIYDNKLYPSFFTSPRTALKLYYTLTNNSTGCKRGKTEFPVTFNIIPSKSSSFIVGDNLPPFCEDGGIQVIDVKFPNDKILTQVESQPVGAAVMNIHENNKIIVYPFMISDSDNVIKIVVTYGVGEKDEAYIPIIPKNAPYITGISYRKMESGGSGISLLDVCVSNNDSTIFKVYPPASEVSIFKIINNERSVLENVEVNNEKEYKTFLKKIFYDVLGGDMANKILIKTKYRSNKCVDSMDYYISFIDPKENQPTFSILNKEPYCYGDTIMLKVNTTTDKLPSVIYYSFFPSWMYKETYTWDFGDKKGLSYSELQQLTHFYDKPDKYDIRFRCTNYAARWQCPVDVIQEVVVGTKPTSKFVVERNIVDSAVVFKNLSDIYNQGENISESHNLINKWKWYYGDGVKDEIGIPETGDVSHKYEIPIRELPFEVSLVASTQLGCTDSLVQDIPLFPLYIPINNGAYVNDFDTEQVYEFNHSGYYRQYSESGTSSWRYTIPVGKDIKSDLYHRAWVTYNNKDTSYSRNEKSWVESPAFILDALERPMVRMNTWVSAEAQIDGVNFQYCIMDTEFGSENWKTLGKIGQGLNWYNSSIIVTKEGFEGGWTGTGATDWQLSAHELDNVKAEADGKPVRFRFSFTSNNENPPGIYNGFAFDNFFIGERNRIVLVENFRNTSTVMGTEITDWENDNQAAVINYYVGHLKKDVINDQNKADPSARALHYGVHQLPRLAIDGLAPSMKDVSWVKDSLEKRKLTTSEFDINFSEVKVEAATGELLLKGTLYRNAITSLERPVLIQVAIIEDQVLVDGQTYSNVLRKLLPNAAGKRIASWAEGATEEIEYRWQPFAIPNSGYTVVVFIQDEQSKEIYQTNTWEISESEAQLLEVKNAQPISTSFRMPVYDEIILFPNPTNTEEVQVLFNGILEEECTWDLKDRLGIVHATGIVPKGVNLTSLVLPDVPSGIYQISFTGKGYRQSAKLSVVK